MMAPEGSNYGRFTVLDSDRTSKLDRMRELAALTLPSVLPPEAWTSKDPLIQPWSSVAGSGVTAMSSRVLSALIPINDMPFFKFDMTTGLEPDGETNEFLETLSYQVYNKLITGNLRSTVFNALQQLIITGDALMVMEDDYSFRCIRQDHYVLRRDIVGKPVEIIHLDFVEADHRNPGTDLYGSMDEYSIPGYKTLFTRCLKDSDSEQWHCRTEDIDGELITEGTYEVSPYISLRWSQVTGEMYGRSHCEEIAGDIQTLDAYTQAMVEGLAAAGSFWVGINPNGVTDIEDVAGQDNGSFISARQEDVFVVSPAQTVQPQLQSISSAVNTMRAEVAKHFLNQSGATRQAERVTATEVRMQGQELETVLGGAFSSIARELFVPIINRTVYLMLDEGLIDPAIKDQFSDTGLINTEIITGLQALSRDNDLQKLMQMGDMVRNLPPDAAQMFRWDEYGRALITALGYDPANWIKREDDVRQQQQNDMAAQQAMQIQGQATQMGAEAAMGMASQAAGQMLGLEGG